MKHNPKKKIAQLLRAAKKAKRTPAEKKKYLENQARKMDKNPTAPEAAFIEMLNSMNIVFETQKIVHGKIFDFFIPHKNTLVEVDGNYWHGYGLKLEEMNDIQQKSYATDKKKDTIAKGFGFNLIRIWEHELEDESFCATKERIRSLLK